VQAVLGKLPLYFIENRGQVDERVAYYVQGRDTSLYFTSLGVTFVLSKPQSLTRPPLRGGERERGDSSTPTRSPFDTLRVNGTDIETGGAFPFVLSPAKHDRHRASSQSTLPVSLQAESPLTDTPQPWVLKLDFVGTTPRSAYAWAPHAPDTPALARQCS